MRRLERASEENISTFRHNVAPTQWRGEIRIDRQWPQPRTCETYSNSIAAQFLNIGNPTSRYLTPHEASMFRWLAAQHVSYSGSFPHYTIFFERGSVAPCFLLPRVSERTSDLINRFFCLINGYLPHSHLFVERSVQIHPSSPHGSVHMRPSV